MKVKPTIKQYQCTFEVWDNKEKRLSICGSTSVAHYGSHTLCYPHLESALAMGKCEMYDKHGKRVYSTRVYLDLFS